jgi:hypothetical protein
MKLFSPATSLVLSLSPLYFATEAQASGVSVVAGFLQESEEESGKNWFLRPFTPGSGCQVAGRNKGEAYLSPSFIKALKKNAGVLSSTFIDTRLDARTSEDEEMIGRNVQTTILTSSSNKHVDHHPNPNGRRGRPLDDERVAFVLLNTNKDAFFDHGDMSIPILEGSLVHFDGGTPHNTVINSGVVLMIGPFLVRGLKSVETPKGCEDPEDPEAVWACEYCILTNENPDFFDHLNLCAFGGDCAVVKKASVIGLSGEKRGLEGGKKTGGKKTKEKRKRNTTCKKKVSGLELVCVGSAVTEDSDDFYQCEAR